MLYMYQKIISYLSVFDLHRVRAVSRTTQRWLIENCDKSLMREGNKTRVLRINLKILEEFDVELKVSSF